VFSSAKDVERALRSIAKRDAAVRGALARYGQPPFWQRGPGFASLAQIILEQQVSLASAQAVLSRVQNACRQNNLASTLIPKAVLALDAKGLGLAGVTRPKQHALLALAQACEAGVLDLNAVSEMDDAAAHQSLTAIKGIGPWTANVYLIFALRRVNAWPDHDVAVHEAIRRMDELNERPTTTQALERAEAWQPYRAAVARLLWHIRLVDTGRLMQA
jgi:DNA-3-methyladenine glycosylase II